MVNWRRRKYSREEFTEAWLSSLSIAQVAKKLGCNTTGGGYITLKAAARELGLDNSHMTGQGWNIGWPSHPSIAREIPLSDILIENSTYTTMWRLKLRLVREALLEYKCYLCGLTEWKGKPITLQLDHINGVHLDHRIENLRLLCPNCHSQTETFAGRNKG
ncbi:MAG TPA: HNH endonuclease signature motif containing protein [Pyrinomonadaceae bacterium]|nr:HNH endonuclease signature motif containing protein [Pyrinomonadaceae bacterium]